MKIEELHNQAIEKAEFALIRKFQKDNETAFLLNKEAFILEKEAALLAKEVGLGEPSESVLLKSAAVLAINCKEYREAERLISIALSDEPPFEIAEELRNLLEDVNFQRHLELKGIVLNSSELQLVISGNSVGYGLVKSEQVFERIKTLEKLTYRIVERKTNKPYRKKGDVPKDIKMSFEPYLSAPRAASMAFTIRLGKNANQDSFPGMNVTEEIIDDLFENLDLVNKGDFETLKSNIPDNDYFDNFVAFTKELAPDGEDVNLVGLSIVREGIKKDVALSKPRKELLTYKEKPKIEVQNEIIESAFVELVGRLSYADDDNDKIKLTTNDNQKHDILISNGLTDIVKRYFGESVIIKGTKDKKLIRLIEIDPV